MVEKLLENKNIDFWNWNATKKHQIQNMKTCIFCRGIRTLVPKIKVVIFSNSMNWTNRNPTKPNKNRYIFRADRKTLLFDQKGLRVDQKGLRVDQKGPTFLGTPSMPSSSSRLPRTPSKRGRTSMRRAKRALDEPNTASGASYRRA